MWLCLPQTPHKLPWTVRMYSISCTASINWIIVNLQFCLARLYEYNCLQVGRRCEFFSERLCFIVAVAVAVTYHFLVGIWWCFVFTGMSLYLAAPFILCNLKSRRWRWWRSISRLPSNCKSLAGRHILVSLHHLLTLVRVHRYLCFHKFTVFFNNPTVHYCLFSLKGEISGFCCGVVEVFTLRGYYTA
jgi:hypothetical protein